MVLNGRNGDLCPFRCDMQLRWSGFPYFTITTLIPLFDIAREYCICVRYPFFRGH
jgi:hypothetical protein